MPPKAKAKAGPKSPSKEKSNPDNTKEHLPRSPSELKNRTVQEARKGAAGSGHLFAMSPNGNETYKAHEGPTVSKKARRKQRKGERSDDSTSLSPQVPAQAHFQGQQSGVGDGDSVGLPQNVQGLLNESGDTADAHTSGYQLVSDGDKEIGATTQGDHEGPGGQAVTTNNAENCPTQLNLEYFSTVPRAPAVSVAHSNLNNSEGRSGKLKMTNSTDDDGLTNPENSSLGLRLPAVEDADANTSTEETTSISDTAGFYVLLKKFNSIIAEIAELKQQHQKIRELIEVLIEKIDTQQGGE